MGPDGELPGCIAGSKTDENIHVTWNSTFLYDATPAQLRRQTYTKKVLHIQWAFPYGKPGNISSSVSQLTTTFMK
jgi:hypothetical protein